ncbi:hypothetical protein DPMN_158265 [Dreissena polymorpha]|uniref:Uncharacterized protein n=1 Tax=Dreissena polymorpha TaxID=45954 RepID=A0A9D4EM04_DREPO|nr:hypothetical protein DPMN_158265 [Dreissena polymorpha]
MMCFLDAVGTTLKQHLKSIAKDVVDASVNDLRVNTTLCIENIKDFMSNCKQELAKQADKHKQDIDEHVDIQKQGIDDHTGRNKQGIDEHVKGHKQGMDKHADIHKQGMDKHADRHKQDMDEHADRHKQNMDEHADRHKQGIDEHASRHKQCLDEQAEKCIKGIQEQFGNTNFTETTYKQSCKGITKVLSFHYTISKQQTFSFIQHLVSNKSNSLDQLNIFIHMLMLKTKIMFCCTYKKHKYTHRFDKSKI